MYGKWIVALALAVAISPLALWAQAPAGGAAPGAAPAGGGGAPGGFGGGGPGGFGGGGPGGGGGFGGGGFGGGGGGFGGGGGGFGAGGFDQMAFIQQQAGFTDDEMKVIQPRLQKVVDAQRAAGVGRGRGFGGFGGGGFGGGGFGGGGGPGGGFGGGGPGGGFGGPPGAPAAAGGATPPATAPQLDPVAQASQDLNTAVQDTATTNDQLKTKLKALRDAREKARAALTAAQDDLKKVVNLKQEATLVTLGYLD